MLRLHAMPPPQVRSAQGLRVPHAGRPAAGVRGAGGGRPAMSEKYLRVTMPDNSQWDVPARLIAEDRAGYYAKARSKGGSPLDQTYEGELAYALGDAETLIDWAANDMDWDDVRERAVQV